MLRIRQASVLGGFRLSLTLTDGSTIERDVHALLTGPIFEVLRTDPVEFAAVRVEGGALTWPNGADLCADMVIWNGTPPKGPAEPAAAAVLKVPARAR